MPKIVRDLFDRFWAQIAIGALCLTFFSLLLLWASH
jgi:hypothetical protein